MIPVEAVTVCVGFDDFLAEVIPFNRVQLSRWLIVTSYRDEATRDLTKRANLECLCTDDFWRDGASFDKGRALDHALGQLDHKGWVLHLDSDIALPPHYQASLRGADLDPSCIYGVDRFNVVGSAKWDTLLSKGFMDYHSRGAHCYVAFPGGYTVGARWADLGQGYTPIGFHQLWWG